MNDMLNEANLYFEHHLQKSKWEGIDFRQRSGVLELAMHDITGYLGTSELDFDDLAARTALFEQAIHIVANEYDNRRIISESIDGLGKNDYQYTCNPAELSPRARRFADNLLRRNTRISRG